MNNEIFVLQAGGWIGFVIWFLVSCYFIGHGISCFKAGKATGFWANARTFEVKDVKKYNAAMDKLWIIYGAVLLLLGLPLLGGQNTPLILISVLGVVVEIMIVIIIYTQVIEKKYRAK